MSQYTATIQQLYVAYFGRPADPIGLQFWEQKVSDNGGSTTAISNAFAASTEYTSTFAGMGTAQTVNQIYLNLFGRGADTEGLLFWSGKYASGALTISNIVTAIAAGAVAGTSDYIALANKTTAAVNFTAALDTTTEIVNYNAVSLPLAKTFIASITTDATLAASGTGAALDATVAAVTAAGAPVPVTTNISLTTGIDTGVAFVGGAGNDTFNAVGTTLVNALNSLDNIDGGAGVNTLNVISSLATNLPAGAVTVKNIQTMNLTDASTVTLDATGFTGLTALNILSSSGADDIKAAATTAVSVVDVAVGGVTVAGGLSQNVSAVGAVTLSGSVGAIVVTETGAGQLADNIAIDDGTTVSVTTSHNTSGTITIGSNSAPTGAVTVATSVNSASTGGLIDITGGTVITVTETATNAFGTNVTAESDVTVHGGATTTTVNITQAAVAAGASAVTGVVGVAGVAAVTAAQGTQAVNAVTAVTAVDAVTAVRGITADGAVLITDSKYNTTSANTITAITLANYGAGSIISDNALTTLNLSGTAGTLRLNNATNGAGGVANANTSLNLNLNALTGTNTITDWNNEITTLNVTTGATGSSLAAFADTALTTLNVAGASALKLSAINASLTKIAVTGAAGFNDAGTTAGNGFAARGAAATFTTTSSGAITLSLDSNTQTFVGSTGKDTIRITSTADATKVITGGSGTTDELILEGGAYALTAATGAKVTGFETLGVASNVTGTINMANLATGITGLHIIGNSTVVFSKVAANTTLKLDVASTSVTYGVANATGAADAVTVTLGGASSDTVNFGTIVLQDANAVGIGTVNLVSNGVNITAGDSTANTNTVVLTDNGLSTLNLTGTQGLTITTLNEATTQATSINLNNNNSSSFGLLIGTLTDTNLGGLTFSGTGTTTITTLTDASSTTLAIGNTGSHLATIGTFTSSAALTSLTLTGNVQIGDGSVGGTGLTTTATSGITVAGATDNAHVKLSLGAAGAGLTNNVVLGNGNDVVTDATIAGTSNVTVGTGSNFLTIGGATTNTTGAFNITLGTHTAASGSDYITVGTGGTAYATVANYVITGAVTGDRIIFNTDAAATLVGHTAGTITAVTAGATVALTIAALEAAVDALAAHGIAYAQFEGNTYVAESISSTLAGTDTTIVEIIGAHTIGAGTGGVGGYALITS
jgi:hypothetical protein